MRPAPKRGRLETALWLLRNGLRPVPIHPREKRPIGNAWGSTRPTRDRLLAVFDRHKGAGVGVMLGPQAGVIDYEVDDVPTAPRLKLPETLGWSSARGEHRLFLWDKRLEGLPTVIHVGGAELRLGQAGKQLVSVCPPSIGKDRRCRRWNECWEICTFPECLLKEINRPTPRPVPRPMSLPPAGNRYAEAALRYEARNVATAREGTRNNQLNRSAFSLGGLIAVGLLTRAAVEAVLTDAALNAGLGEQEIAATLKSGLEAGLNRPREV
jgi:hypothetical protein